MSDTDYSSWTKADLIAEFKRRGLDGPYGSDLRITARTRKPELVSELVDDDFFCEPCHCPACSGARDFARGDWETPWALWYIEEMQERSGDGSAADDRDLWRYRHVMRLRERADLLHSRARRQTPGSPHHRWLFERERECRERERRTRMRDWPRRET